MTRLVMDSSVAIAWCVRSQATTMTDNAEVYVTTHGAMQPAHFQLEVANGLWRLQRRKHIAQAAIDRFLSDLLLYGIEYDDKAVSLTFSAILPLARAYGLGVYDAAYLETALRLQLPLATRDVSLAAAAQAAGAQLFQP